jgi:hypothetical protein
MLILNPLKKYQKSVQEESYRAENFCTQYLKLKKYISNKLYFPILVSDQQGVKLFHPNGHVFL